MISKVLLNINIHLIKKHMILMLELLWILEKNLELQESINLHYYQKKLNHQVILTYNQSAKIQKNNPTVQQR